MDEGYGCAACEPCGAALQRPVGRATQSHRPRGPCADKPHTSPAAFSTAFAPAFNALGSALLWRLLALLVPRERALSRGEQMVISTVCASTTADSRSPPASCFGGMYGSASPGSAAARRRPAGGGGAPPFSASPEAVPAVGEGQAVPAAAPLPNGAAAALPAGAAGPECAAAVPAAASPSGAGDALRSATAEELAGVCEGLPGADGSTGSPCEAADRFRRFHSRSRLATEDSEQKLKLVRLAASASSVWSCAM